MGERRKRKWEGEGRSRKWEEGEGTVFNSIKVHVMGYSNRISARELAMVF